MADQKFRYTTFDGEQHQLNLAVLHIAKAELELDISAVEFDGRIEPQLVAAHKAWEDTSAANRAHFLSWCSEIDSVDGHTTYVTVDDGDPVVVPYRVFVEAERYFKKSFVELTHRNTLNLRMFIVWKVLQPAGGDFYKWLAELPEDFVCDVYSESDGDDRPKE